MHPYKRRGCGYGRNRSEDVTPVNAGCEYHEYKDDRNSQRRAVVPLEMHQQDRSSTMQAERQNILGTVDLFTQNIQVIGERKNK